MGRAIVREPQAFLMDEPLSNLDAKLRVSMRAALNQLHERLGTTTVYVTHDQVEAMTLGHRVCVLRDGRLQQVDTPQKLFESPVNLFVAGFIGSPAMNFATADLARDDGPAVTFAGYRLPVPASVLEAKQGLDGYLGKQGHPGHPPVGLRGRRASATPRGRDSVTVGVTEELGTEIHAIFTIDAPPVEHACDQPGHRAPRRRGRGRRRALRRQVAVDRARVGAVPRPSGQPLELAVDTTPPALLRPGQRRVHRPLPWHGGSDGGTALNGRSRALRAAIALRAPANDLPERWPYPVQCGHGYHPTP